ncbi:ROK family protein [Virgibacillus profundi]|uniref:ROK family protein n=1 Tax=Virgibacillus profundi TaxID=2024555 RepID=A0A2A2IGW7_9BACI|nr:ROK family transcriptional regulator [Virgibacillus profundi]PAV30608.1 ROK family protein [Virgibacillus profundi]PXY54780.1 ROK family transcriptional regulator [Virgibacillus profundi]
MVTGDGAYIKKINRSLLLQKIIEHGLISRADLSKITGLNKATISVQVANLLEEELIYETQHEHNSVGRKPIMLTLNSKAGYVLGIDFDYHHVQYTLSNLQGESVQSDTIKLENHDYDVIVQMLIKEIQKYNAQCSNSRYGLVNVVIGIHGTVNKDESILFVPKYQWHHKNLKADLQKELNINIAIENNANLSSYAERVFKYHNSDNLLNIILSSGIGAGIMIDGEIHKGYHGYAGEMGHMIISPDGKACKCGNNGCWERYASEPSLFEQLSKQLNMPDLNFDDLKTLIDEQDTVTCAYLKQYIEYLAIGLNNIINLYNPENLVINSDILRMYPNAIEEIKSNLKSSVSQYREITLSDLGSESCVMGACALAIQRFLEVPELILKIDEDGITKNDVKVLS